MSLPRPGDTFPRLTINIPGARAVQVPGWLGRSPAARAVAGLTGGLVRHPLEHAAVAS